MALQLSGLPVASLGSIGRLAASRHVFSGRLNCRPQYPRNLRGLLDEEEEVPYERLAQGKRVLNPAARPSTLADGNVRLFSFQRLTVIAVFFLNCFLAAVLPARERNSEVLKDTARRKLFTEHHVTRFHPPGVTW